VNSRRPVNSNVIAPRTNGKTFSLNQGLNGFAFSARLVADGTCVVGRRYNKSLDRSAFSWLFIRKTRMLGSWPPRPVNSDVIRFQPLPRNMSATDSPNETRGCYSRPIVSIVAGFALTAIAFLISDHVPLIIATLLNIPGAIFCYVDSLIETPPADDVPLWEMGREATCYFAGILLNIPFYSLVVFVILSVRARVKRPANEARV
jgi:hypothetical protein